MTGELLRAPEAARRLGMPTKEMLRLMYERKIRYVMVKASLRYPMTPSRSFVAVRRNPPANRQGT
jgi:hypothetical protein